MEKIKAYRRKRDFEQTREPTGSGRADAKSGHCYVMHKHAASQDHFDLRLEQDGVLRSWALPKGPSLEPGEKRLAVEVENHPLEYADFEGVIPEKSYGGGTVMLWDRGTWQAKGKSTKDRLDIELDGERLKGSWTLTRMSDKRQDKHGRNWLLIKHHDDKPRMDDSLTVELDVSIFSGRSMNEIAEDRDNTWVSADNADEASLLGVRLTSPDRVLFPEQGLTKLDLARFYDQIQEWVLPHLVRRPLSLVRCPEGRDDECFFQKHPDRAIPDSVPRIDVLEKKGSAEYVYVETAADLVGLVQAGALEIHPWGSRIDDLEHPDSLVFDLDPGEGIAWKEILRVAGTLRERIESLGLTAFVRTTGGKGLHLVVPLEPCAGWDQARAFAKGVAEAHAKDDPKWLTTNMSKAKREGRIFIDYLRNGRGATAVASYTVRARKGAPVAVPIRWDELNAAMRADRYHVKNLRRRLSALRQDPWADFSEAARPLDADLLKRAGIAEKE